MFGKHFDAGAACFQGLETAGEEMRYSGGESAYRAMATDLRTSSPSGLGTSRQII
jgi:hypothetical protein